MNNAEERVDSWEVFMQQLYNVKNIIPHNASSIARKVVNRKKGSLQSMKGDLLA